MSPEMFRLIGACLSWYESEKNFPSAYYDADLEYREEMILEAAKALVSTQTHIDP